MAFLYLQRRFKRFSFFCSNKIIRGKVLCSLVIIYEYNRTYFLSVVGHYLLNFVSIFDSITGSSSLVMRE